VAFVRVDVVFYRTGWIDFGRRPRLPP